MPCAEYACPSQRGATLALRIAKSTGWNTPLPIPMIAATGNSHSTPGTDPATSVPPASSARPPNMNGRAPKRSTAKPAPNCAIPDAT